MIKKLENQFGEYVKNTTLCKTPGTPNQGATRPEEGDNLIGKEEQSIYRSRVGMLLHLVKYSRPDIANVVRELSKCMDKANPAALKEFNRVVKFGLSTKQYGLKVYPVGDIKNWI